MDANLRSGVGWILEAGSTPPSLDLVLNFNFSASCKSSLCCASVAQLAAAYACASNQPTVAAHSKSLQPAFAVSASEAAVVAFLAGAAVAGQFEATAAETIAVVPAEQAQLLIDSRTGGPGLVEAVAVGSALPQPSLSSSPTISKDAVRDTVQEALRNAGEPLLSSADTAAAGPSAASETAQPAVQCTASPPDQAHPVILSPTAKQTDAGDAVQPQALPSSALPDAAPGTAGRGSGRGSIGGRCVS